MILPGIEVFVGKINLSTYTCRYGPVSTDLSVVVLITTGPRDIPHRRGSESGAGPLESVSRSPVPDSKPRSLCVRYRTRRQDL